MPLTVEFGRSKKAIPGTPASTLAEVFLQACATFKVEPASHALRYKKKDLDLTLPLRLANLPAGAVAELCELDATEAAARTVQVTLQRDDGSRTQGAFLCNTSLWDVLKRFEDLGGARLVSECEKVPCVSFMRPTPRWEGREALEGQTLLRLGLVSGSALLKHSFAAPAPDDTQAAAEAPAVAAPASMDVDSAPSTRGDAAGDAVATGDTMGDTAPATEAAVADADGGADDGGAGGSARTGQGSARPLLRQWRVGRPREDGGGDVSMAEVDDSFFELTAADIAQLEATKKSKDKEPAFKTRKMRDMEREAKLAAFKTVSIRVVFPNQQWIQAQFGSDETLGDIYQLVREALVVQDRPFSLITTPPPSRLPDDATAIKYTNLLPSARVMMNWCAPPFEAPYLTFAHISEMERQEQESVAASASPDASAVEAASPQEGGGGAGDASGGRGEGRRQGGETSLKNEDGKAFQWGVRGGGGGGSGGEFVCGGDANEDMRGAAVTAAEKRAQAGKKPKWFKMP
eukprot:Tamp_03580.p2 GENE.Tamp_03580~~Tamp_03580.p2  ORF type:complete len:517 (-),score=123.72 Tamp_03580:2015-3565(-)